VGRGPESHCVGCVYGLDCAVRLDFSSLGVVRVNDQLKQGSDCLGFVPESVSFLGGIVCRAVHGGLVKRYC